jgi:hypothetical protein
MNNQQDQSTKQQGEDKLKESPSLWVETHLKISDPETKEQIVNTRA